MTSSPDSVLDQLLADYASGVLTGPARVAVASHLVLSAENRAFVRALETLAGQGLSEFEPEPIGDRDRMLTAILSENPDAVGTPPAEATLSRTGLPAPLRDFLGCELDEVRWKWVLPGIWNFRPAPGGSADAQLIWVRRGKPLPSHTHRGLELILVLQGGLRDETGRCRRGDLFAADESLDHRPVADPDADCICFAVYEAPLKLTGPIGRLFERFIRRN